VASRRPQNPGKFGCDYLPDLGSREIKSRCQWQPGCQPDQQCAGTDDHVGPGVGFNPAEVPRPSSPSDESGPEGDHQQLRVSDQDGNSESDHDRSRHRRALRMSQSTTSKPEVRSETPIVTTATPAGPRPIDLLSSPLAS
jgi:hypothetical protein